MGERQRRMRTCNIGFYFGAPMSISALIFGVFPAFCLKAPDSLGELASQLAGAEPACGADWRRASHADVAACVASLSLLPQARAERPAC